MIRLLIVIVFGLALVSCNDKNCYFGMPKEVYKKYPLPNNTWFDSIDEGVRYKYLYKTPTGLSDELEVFRSDLRDDDGGWNNCDHILFLNPRVFFHSQNYGYDFHFEVDDLKANNEGEVIVIYSGSKKSQDDYFYLDSWDSTRHRLQITNYESKFDTTVSGRINFLPEFTNQAGLEFTSVFKFTPLTSELFVSENHHIREFYATRELGVVEYVTNGGYTYSYIRRKFF